MRARTINENNEQPRFLLKTITFDDVKPFMEDSYSRPFIKISNTFMSSRKIYNEKDFYDWKDEFVEKYGESGYVVIERKGMGEIKNNDLFNKHKEIGTKSITNFYRNS